MNYKELLREIKANDIGKVYLFYGDEYFLSKIMIDRLKEKVINPMYQQLNVSVLEGKEISIDDIINMSETLPFIDDKRLIIIKDFPLLNPNENASSKDVDILCKYLQETPNTTVLVFTNKKIDKRKKLFKALQDNGKVVQYNKLNKEDIIKWIRKKVKQKGKNISPQGLELFIEQTNYLDKNSSKNLEDIENEIDKLIAFSKETEIITNKEVEATAPKNINTDIFKFLDLIGNDKASDALVLLNVLFKDGEPSIKILFMIVRQFRIIYYCKLLREEGFSTNEIAKIVEIRPFAVNNALKQGKKFSFTKLKEALTYCANIDIRIKKGEINSELALEMLVYKFA